MPYEMPSIDETIICIVDRESVPLAAVISSYFSCERTYFPLFTFPSVKVGQTSDDEVEIEDRIPQMIGQEAAIGLQNILAHLPGCETLILAGLSNAQLSYIKPDEIKCKRLLKIGSVGDVDSCLKTIGIERTETLRCRPGEVLRGLYAAKSRGHRLWVADDAEPLADCEQVQGGGLVVVEQTFESSGSVVAINYAHSIDAGLRVVDPLARFAESRSVDLIYKWQYAKDTDAWRELFDEMGNRIGDIAFEEFDFVTFFTDGLPYGIYLNGAIPCTYMSLGLFPDRLIVNAILRERELPRLASAVVFATNDFYKHDESAGLIDFLTRHQYAVRPVVGGDATVIGLDYHVEHYPYDLIHISTHGGEVAGSLVELTFSARDQSQHVVSYDRVIGLGRTPDENRQFFYQERSLFKSLDGFEWGSPVLRDHALPDFVYSDALKAIRRGTGVSKRRRKGKDRISGGHVIQCNDGYYLAMVRTIAAYGHPVVFNNTCSSWSGINHFFLASGAVAYIGTHWDVPDDTAIAAAKTFYEGAVKQPLMDAVHTINKSVAGTSDANIFAFWGLHFSTLTVGEDIRLSVNYVGSQMAKTIGMYADYLCHPMEDELKETAARALRGILKDFNQHFGGSNAAKVKERAESVLSAIPRPTRRVIKN